MSEENRKCDCRRSIRGGGDMVYCLGMIGAAVYYISQAATFGEGVIGFAKAVVWPAFVVHQLLTFLFK